MPNGTSDQRTDPRSAGAPLASSQSRVPGPSGAPSSPGASAASQPTTHRPATITQPANAVAPAPKTASSCQPYRGPPGAGSSVLGPRSDGTVAVSRTSAP